MVDQSCATGGDSNGWGFLQKFQRALFWSISVLSRFRKCSDAFTEQWIVYWLPVFVLDSQLSNAESVEVAEKFLHQGIWEQHLLNWMKGMEELLKS